MKNKTRKGSFQTALWCFLIIIVLNFLLPRLMPGDAIAYLSGMAEDGMTTVQYEYYEHALHLDEGLFGQFLHYLKSLVDGTLGYSFRKESAVLPLILERLGATMLLVLPSAFFSSVLGLYLGLESGYGRKKLDRILTPCMLVLNAVPVFLASLLLLMIFAFGWELFPYGGLSSARAPHFLLDRLWHLFLPVLTLTLTLLPSRYLLVRNMTTEQGKTKPVLYARERGLSPSVIRRHYILPNLAGTYLTSVGMSIGSGIAGTVVVENIFSINGMGRLLNEAIYSLDYPLLQGILFVTSFAMVVAIALTDILSYLVDPRERRRHGQ